MAPLKDDYQRRLHRYDASWFSPYPATGTTAAVYIWFETNTYHFNLVWGASFQNKAGIEDIKV